MSPKFFFFAATCLLATRGATGQGVNDVPAAYPVGAPTAAASAPIMATSPQLELLHQKIAQRDQLQREIDQLIIATQTPQMIEVHLELLEVNVAAAEKLGINLETLTPEQLEELRRAGATQTRSRPKFMASSGQQFNSQVGDAQKVECRADSLGNNRVRMTLYVAAKSNADGDSKSPQGKTLSADTSLELNFSETRILSGLLSKRTQTRRGALGRVTETVTTQTMLVVRAEPIMPRTAGVVPAAFTHR